MMDIYAGIPKHEGIILFFLLFVLLSNFSSTGAQIKMVHFEDHTNVGKILHKGSVVVEEAKGTYEVTGSGENMWFNEDAFFYLWNKTEGDLSMSMRYDWIGEGKQAHRKAGWMVRQNLDADAPYVDAVIHGDGLISMQYRKIKGGLTYELRAPVAGNTKLLLEKTADQFTFYFLDVKNDYHPVGTISVNMRGEIYAGLAVCSHDSTTEETAIFSEVEFVESGIVNDDERMLESTLETINIQNGVRTIIRRAKEHFEAPNWTPDGKTFIYNSGGKLYSLAGGGGEPKEINTSFSTECNNDHGISPDGKELVISHHAEDHKSIIYTLPVEGGEPERITPNGPSYWHGWSPDGKTLAYCAERNGQYDIYTIPIEGGQETQLTNTTGLDDGPDFSPDGKYIYFNSVRTGQMKIWRMKANGKDQRQWTPDDEYGDWFAHPSPDGKMLIFVSYDKSVEGHPPDKDVVLRLMPAEGGEPKIIAQLFGGQGTINVPSWSPDNIHAAFVSYRKVKK